MDCPHCNTPIPAHATRCVHCDTPIDVDSSTLVDAGEEQPAEDANLTVDNWSAAVTAPSTSESPRSVNQLQPGSLLAARYEILDRLGVGGMGAVYKAKDREVDRLVALKVIRTELAGDSDILSRFKQELILARKVTHKNVIRIFDLGRDRGLRFITMEYIEGQDLRSLVKSQGRPTPEASVEIIQQVCLALEAAHAEGVVHRDLKPQNIMIDKQGRVYVMDFGIARSVGSEGLTMTGALVGTPEYMSPEQVKGEDVDGRSDLFSLGIIFYELLTGKMPYRGETVQRAMFKRTVERPLPASAEESSVPPFLSEVTSKCLEIQPEKRYQSARELSADLDSWRSGAADGTGSVLQRWIRRTLRNRNVLISAAAAVLLVVGMLSYQRLASSGPAGQTAANPPSVALAVLPFRNASGDPQLDWLGSSIGEMLTNDIGQSATLRTVPTGRVSQVMNDLRVKPNDNLDSATTDRVAEFANADILVWGQYVKFGELLRINATVANRKNGRQVPLQAEAHSDKEILATVDQLAKQIRENLALSSSAVHELQSSAFKPSSNSLDALRDYDKGLQLQRAGKNIEAQVAFKSSILQDPQFALAYSHLATVYASMGRDDQAQAASLKAVDLSEQLPPQERYLIRANHAEILKEYPKAIEAYETLAKASPGDTDILMELAKLYESSGDVEKARSYLEKVQSLDPRSTEALLARGRVELEANNPEKGLEFLNTALNLAIQVGNEELKADILQAIGVGYANMQRSEDALKSYQDSLAIKQRLGLQAGAAASLEAIATLQNSMGKSNEALKNYKDGLEISRKIGDKSRTGNILIDLGSYYVDHGKTDQALSLFKESLQIQIDLGNEQNRALVLSNIGNIYLSRGEFQEAHTYFEQALQIREKFKDPQDLAETLHNLAETATNLGLLDQAIDQYHRALDLQRKIGNKQMIAIETFSLGTVFGFQGRYGAALGSKEEALKTYRELGEHSFWTAEILAGYGNSLAQVGRREEAQANLEEALALARQLKNDDQVAMILGFQGDNAYYSGDPAAARKLYTQSSQAAAHSPNRILALNARFNLARLSVEQSHPQEAIASLKSLADETARTGPRYLSLQSSFFLAKALKETRDYTKAQELLETGLIQAEKLGLLWFKAQGHGLMSQILKQEGKAAEAATEQTAAANTFREIQSEGHFDVHRRADFAPYLQ